MVIEIAFQKSETNPSVWDNLLSEAIKFWTDSKYFHVAVGIDGTWYTSRPDSGVVIDTIDESNFDIIRFEHFELNEESYLIAMKYIHNQVGCKYDWKGIFLSQFVRFGINSDDKWFCSEICTKILQLMYVEEVMDAVPNKVSPQKLYELVGGLK